MIANCFCLMAPFFALTTALSCGARAWKKGYNGPIFGLLFVLVCGVALLTGALTGMVVKLTIDPSSSKDAVGGAMALGGILGGSYGMGLMTLVTKMMPDRTRDIVDELNLEPSDA